MVGARRRVPLPPARQPPATTHPRTCQADEGETKKRRKAEDDGGIGDKAIKWAEEFDSLGEDDQYTYLEELAPRMRCLAHLCTHAGDGLASYPFRPCPLCGLQAGTPAWEQPESLSLSLSLSLGLSPTLALALTLLAVTPPRSLHPRPEPHRDLRSPTLTPDLTADADPHQQDAP